MPGYDRCRPYETEGMVTGAIGISAGTVEQDIEVAEVAIGAIEASIQTDLSEFLVADR